MIEIRSMNIEKCKDIIKRYDTRDRIMSMLDGIKEDHEEFHALTSYASIIWHTTIAYESYKHLSLEDYTKMFEYNQLSPIYMDAYNNNASVNEVGQYFVKHVDLAAHFLSSYIQ